MFSLRMLLIVVTLCSVYTAGMVFRTPWWEASILTLTYIIFAGSIAAAILSHSRRAFFVTFAAFGLAYGIAVYLRMELVTTRALDELASRSSGVSVVLEDGDRLVPLGNGQPASYVNPFEVEPELNVTNVTVSELSLPMGNAPSQPSATAPRQPDPDPYGSILRLKSTGQAFFAVLFGLVMGMVAEIVAKKTTPAAS